MSDPPAAPTFDANVVQSLELTNVSNVVAVKLVCSGSSDAFNLVWAAAPQSQGIKASPQFNYLGELPAIQSGKADVTSLYAAKLGLPAVGQKVFIRSKQMENGYEDLPHQWSGIVPASS